MSGWLTDPLPWTVAAGDLILQVIATLGIGHLMADISRALRRNRRIAAKSTPWARWRRSP